VGVSAASSYAEMLRGSVLRSPSPVPYGCCVVGALGMSRCAPIASLEQVPGPLAYRAGVRCSLVDCDAVACAVVGVVERSGWWVVACRDDASRADRAVQVRLGGCVCGEAASPRSVRTTPRRLNPGPLRVFHTFSADSH
jgi:hypothetical protein